MTALFSEYGQEYVTNLELHNQAAAHADIEHMPDNHQIDKLFGTSMRAGSHVRVISKLSGPQSRAFGP